MRRSIGMFESVPVRRAKCVDAAVKGLSSKSEPLPLLLHTPFPPWSSSLKISRAGHSTLNLV
eukprot:1846638-Lingulodinium_polyedra.AAC.1